MGMVDFPLARGVIERVPNPERDAFGVLPQFVREVADWVR
jgi:hypothetical protein